MQFMKGLVVAAAASLLVACGGGSPMDKAFAMGDKMISIIESNKTDLDKAAKRRKQATRAGHPLGARGTVSEGQEAP